MRINKRNEVMCATLPEFIELYNHNLNELIKKNRKINNKINATIIFGIIFLYSIKKKIDEVE